MTFRPGPATVDRPHEDVTVLPGAERLTVRELSSRRLTDVLPQRRAST